MQTFTRPLMLVARVVVLAGMMKRYDRSHRNNLRQCCPSLVVVFVVLLLCHRVIVISLHHSTFDTINGYTMRGILSPYLNPVGIIVAAGSIGTAARTVRRGGIFLHQYMYQSHDFTG